MPYLTTEINMSTPICNCYVQGDFGGYDWGITPEINLIVTCPECKTNLEVPRDKFTGRVLILNKEANEERKYNRAKLKQDTKEERETRFKVLEFAKSEDTGEG